mgnify:CR=1 FL=1
MMTDPNWKRILIIGFSVGCAVILFLLIFVEVSAQEVMIPTPQSDVLIRYDACMLRVTTEDKLCGEWSVCTENGTLPAFTSTCQVFGNLENICKIYQPQQENEVMKNTCAELLKEIQQKQMINFQTQEHVNQFQMLYTNYTGCMTQLGMQQATCLQEPKVFERVKRDWLLYLLIAVLYPSYTYGKRRWIDPRTGKGGSYN